MPIVVEHQPPLNVVGAGAYNAGVMEGVAKRREELWNRQMQVAAMQQADRAQRLNLMGQQQAQQAANQRMLMENYLDQQNAATQNAARMQAFNAEQAAQTQRDSRLHDFDMQRMGKQQDFEVMDTANKTRGELEQLLGSAESMNLTPAAQDLRTRVTNDLDELNKNIGSLRPADYHHAVNEILGRAKGLMLPRMQVPDEKPEDIIAKSVYNDPNTGRTFIMTDKGPQEKGFHTVNGQKVGVPFKAPNGEWAVYDTNGDLKPAPNEGVKLKATILNDIQTELDKEEKTYAASAPIPSFGSDGKPVASSVPLPGLGSPMKPSWMDNPQARQSEIQRRFQDRLTMLGMADAPPQAPPVPTGEQLVDHALDPNSYRSQPEMMPQQQQPQVTAMNPGGQPQPQEIPEPEQAAAEAMNPQQPQQPAQQPPADVSDRLQNDVQLIRNAAPQIEPKKIERLKFLASEIKAGRLTEEQLKSPEYAADLELMVEVQQYMRAGTGTAPRGYMQ
jgi:hypothetical protein